MINIWNLNDEERANLKPGTQVTAGENNPGIYCGQSRGGSDLVVWLNGLTAEEAEQKVIEYRKLAGNYGTLKDLQNECFNAIKAAEAEGKAHYKVIRARHELIAADKNGNRLDNLVINVTKANLSQKRLAEIIEEFSQDAECYSVIFSAAHDGADTVRDLNDLDFYDPFVSNASVTLWERA